MNCKIYRCSKRDEMYLYIHESKTTDDLPEELIKTVKQLTHVMDLELTPDRKLARENVVLVMKNLEENGYHLQMPVDPLKPDLYHGD
ncbi:MAG: YcgL domain-containing protein [Proteobacteria bacterium]|nr:YcgL domain-containing protein [Pseudomonadota bacterium]